MTSQRPSVLLVDDEPAVTNALDLNLSRDYNVYTANSGAAALAVLRKDPIDVVVSDQQMPGMSGSRLLTQVRIEHPDTVRIILSGQADVRATLDAINEAQVYRFLLKPCPAADVASIIAEGLFAREESRATTKPTAAPDEDHQSRGLLDAAIRSLWLAAQPIVRATDRSVFAYELLVRSDQPGLELPGALLPLAKRLGRTTELERAIRRLAASAAREIPEGVNLFVNILPESLDDAELHSPGSRLAGHAQRVFLEITERERLSDNQDVLDKLGSLRRLGYGVALDDLGSGYSSLTTFAVVRPEVVKFDLEFMREIGSSPMKARLLKSMTTLCREMGISTIAEGVETEEEFSAASGLGCEFIQGYLIARPTRIGRQPVTAAGFAAARR